MRRHVTLVLLLQAVAATTFAQPPNRSLRRGIVTPFADAGAAGELLAVRGPSGTHPSVAGGLYLGGGLDTRPWMFGFGLEGYLLAPAHGVDGVAGTLAITSAFHLWRDRHVDALFSVGYSGYALDSLPRQELGFNTTHSGPLVRAGISRELSLSSLESVVYSAEVELRPQAAGFTIRSPSVRIGVTWRSRIQYAIQVPRGGLLRAVRHSVDDSLETQR